MLPRKIANTRNEKKFQEQVEDQSTNLSRINKISIVKIHSFRRIDKVALARIRKLKITVTITIYNKYNITIVTLDE